MSARDLAIADVTVTLTDAARGNYVDGDDEALSGIAVELVDQIERRYGIQPVAEEAGPLKEEASR